MNFDVLSQWLSQHPDWILGSILLMSMLESLAVVGLVTPGIALLFITGSAAGSAQLPLWSVILASYIGAVLGDTTSFVLGSRFHSRIIALKPFRQHPEWIEKAEAFFRRYGAPGLLVGRFIGPLRPTLPMIAGALEMPFWRFFALTLCSGPLWGAVYLTPGYLVGSASGVALGSSETLMLSIGILLLCAVAAAEGFRQFQRVERSALQARQAGVTVLGLACALLITIYFSVLAGYAIPINRWIAIEAAALRQPLADNFFVIVTSLGEFLPMTLWAIVLVAVLLVQRAWWSALLWISIALTGNALMQSMKRWLEIERPHLSHTVPDGYSFPSGHASMALIFAGGIALIAWPRLQAHGRRIALYATACYTALVTGSRLYLGAHWLTDLLAGWALGAAVLALAWLLTQYKPFATTQSLQNAPRPESLYLGTLAAWLAIGAFIIVPQLPQAMSRYASVYSTVITQSENSSTKPMVTPSSTSVSSAPEPTLPNTFLTPTGPTPVSP